MRRHSLSAGLIASSLAFAACGRIGYDGVDVTSDAIDAAGADVSSSRDAGTANDAPMTAEVLSETSSPVDGGLQLYLEAEDGILSGGFTIGMDPSASGGRYIEPPAGVTSLNQPG